jgi:hypothetical protein
MNARPNPETKPPGKRSRITLALLSGGVGALIAVLAIVILTPQVRLRMADVTQLFRSRTPTVTESPAAIMQWYHGFDNEAAGRKAAAERYYNRHVAWELLLDDVKPVGDYAQTITRSADTASGAPPHTIWAFFVDPADVAQLRVGETVAVRGKIVFINTGNIFLGDCQLLDPEQG